MKYFWQGFEKKTGAAVQFKKHVIAVFWSPDDKAQEVKGKIKSLSFKYPSVKVKLVNVKKDPARPIRHEVREFPTVLLLKDGREIERLSEKDQSSMLLEHFFRKAHT